MELEHRVFVPLVFVLSGSANILLAKIVDIQKGECADGEWRNFQHPVFLTALMFLGQLFLLLIYESVNCFLRHRRDGSENDNLITRFQVSSEFSKFSFVLPATLDVIASMLLFTGLYLTYASSFQIIRGAAIIFVGVFSSIYLNQTLTSRHWLSMFTISCGLTIVISVDVQRVVYDRASLVNSDANAILTGSLLIICAQIFHAAQFVYEEKYLKTNDIAPMQAAGLQGLYGFCITLLLSVALNFIPTELPFIQNSRGVFDDLGDIFVQLRSNIWLTIALSAFVLTSALYNYAALTIVKFSSSSNRVLADGLRVILIWLFSLLFNWEILNFVSLIGFVILQMGVISYRNAIFLEWYRSLLLRVMRRRYGDLSEAEEGPDSVNEANNEPMSRPADVV